ncbi:MAG: ABC transporter permease [Lentisphaeraceae bacterium]|nr:ABC transporter permease [Lentisphaeraceae bacterium]
MSSRFSEIVIDAGNKAYNFLDFLKQLTIFAGECVFSLLRAVKNPKSVKWMDIFYYMDMCGREAVPIVSLICFLMGLILGFQAAIQLHQFGTDIYVADLVGLSIVKELGPLMVGIICCGRAGSAFAAEIGTMKVNEEIDALYTMGHEPFRFLAFPKVVAMVLVMPLLTIIGDIAGVLGGYVVGVFKLGLPTAAYINQSVNAIYFTDILEGLFKSLVFAINISFVGCLQGLQSKNDAQGVGRAATTAVVNGILFLIIADTIITVLLNS